MDWLGDVCFGSTSAIYTGRSGQNDLHAHAAIQIIFNPSQRIELIDANARRYIAHALYVPPMVRHLVPPDILGSILYIDAKSPLLSELVVRQDRLAIQELNLETLPFELEDADRIIITKLDAVVRRESSGRDIRLTTALETLAENPGKVSIEEAAATVELSASRLRALAQKQLGFPLSTWVLWRKLERAAQGLASGMSLADAAIAGGFSDQAHFTRTMRRMFGISPMSARHSLVS